MTITPITVLEYNEGTKKYQFDVTQLTKIASSDEIKDLPIAVISIVGDYRKGKSFLLNYFIRFLKHYNQEDWIGDQNESLEGFSWRQGTEICTTGIVLWPEPFIITRKDGTRIVILLMDTQGFFDDETKKEDINYIFAISSLLSSIQIYNVFEHIQNKDLTQLSQFIQYSKEKHQFTGSKGLQKLLLLIRDWSASCDYQFGSDGGKQFLENIKKYKFNGYHEKWKTIDDCYSTVDCFLMPHPGLKAIRKGFEGQVSQLDPCFVNSLNELVMSLLSPENIVIKENNGKPMKMWEFVTFFKIFAESSENNVSLSFESLLDIEYENIASNASILAMAEFMKKYIELNPNKDTKMVNYAVVIAKASATLFYYEKTKGIDPEIAVSYLEDFNDSLEEYLENFFSSYAKESTEDSQNSWYNVFSNVSSVALSFLSFLNSNWYIFQRSFEIFEEIYSRRTNARKAKRNNRRNNRRRRR